MNKEKKILVFGIIWIMIISICGCGSNRIDEDETAQNLANQIFENLNNKDTEGLKNLFSQNVLESYDLNKEIEFLFENFEGKIVSYDDFGSCSAREKVEYGKQKLLVIELWINNIKTDTDEVYEIRFSAFIVNDEDENSIGIDGLKIIAEDGTEYLVGDW